MSDRDDMLREAVVGKMVDVHMTTYEQVKDYYQDKAGARGWIGAMAAALSPRQAGVSAKQDKGYSAARRSIERLEKGQFKNMRKYSPQMAAVGKTLPPIGKKIPGDAITITVKGEQREGKKGTRSRNITVTFKGADAYSFADNPSYGDIWDEYGVDSELFEDGDYAIDVYAVA